MLQMKLQTGIKCIYCEGLFHEFINVFTLRLSDNLPCTVRQYTVAPLTSVHVNVTQQLVTYKT